MAPATTYEEAISFEPLRPQLNGTERYISNHGPGTNHYAEDYQVAFGGAVIAFGVSAASRTVPKTLSVYSCLGHFLQATAPNEPVIADVRTLRQSRSFLTRHVTLLQSRKGREVAVASMSVDFHVDEEAVLVFSSPPTRQHSSSEASFTTDDARMSAKNKGIPEEILQVLDGTMSVSNRYFDRVYPPSGFFASTHGGMMPFLDESQTHLTLPEKAGAWYWRSKRSMATPIANAAAVAFVMDTAMGIVAPGFAGIDLRDVSKTSSLDFALRFFSSTIKFDQWHLCETKAVTAGAGRSFQESRLWDQEGRMIAAMSQQCILRGHPKEKL